MARAAPFDLSCAAVKSWLVTFLTSYRPHAALGFSLEGLPCALIIRCPGWPSYVVLSKMLGARPLSALGTQLNSAQR